IVIPQWLLPRALGPAGLITGPVADLLAFARMHLNGGIGTDEKRVLSAESVAAMQESQVVLDDPYTLGQAWGLGWILYHWGSDPVIGHDGNTLGQAAYLRLVPERKLAVGLLPNGSSMAVYETLYGEVLRELAGISVPKKPTAAADQSGFNLVPFTGVFERLGVKMTFEVADAQLQMKTDSPGPPSDIAPHKP